MSKLKRSYELLDLPFSATKEDILKRERAIEKYLEQQETEKNKTLTKERQMLKKSVEITLENLEKNGPPKEEDFKGEISWMSLIYLLGVLLVAIFACGLSIYMLN